MIVPRAALVTGLRALRELRETAVSGEDRAWWAELEERATTIDRLSDLIDVDARARAAVKRRLLLAELRTLTGNPDPVSYPRLAAYRRAEDDRQRYARGSERAPFPAPSSGSNPPSLSTGSGWARRQRTTARQRNGSPARRRRWQPRTYLPIRARERSSCGTGSAGSRSAGGETTGRCPWWSGRCCEGRAATRGPAKMHAHQGARQPSRSRANKRAAWRRIRDSNS